MAEQFKTIKDIDTFLGAPAQEPAQIRSPEEAEAFLKAQPAAPLQPAPASVGPPLSAAPATEPVPIPQPRGTGEITPGVTSPIAPPDVSVSTEEDLEQTGILTFPETVDPVIQRAAESGVAFQNPAPDKGIALTGFAINDENRALAIKLSLQEKFGLDVPVRIGPQTGEIEFQDPNTERWSLAIPPGKESGLLEFVGPATVSAQEIGGGVFAALTTRSPYLTVLGESAGTFIGELMRIETGIRAGINRGVTDEQMREQGFKAAGLTAAGGVVSAKAMKMGGLIVDMVKGRSLVKALEDLDLDITLAEATELQTIINRRIIGQRLQFTLGQSSKNEDILAMEEFFRKGKEFAPLFREVDENQRAALGEFFDTINKPYTTRLSPEETAERFQSIAESNLTRHKRMADVNVERAEIDLHESIQPIKSRSRGQTFGRMLRNVGDKEYKKFKEWGDEHAQKLHIAAGEAEFIPNRKTFEMVSKLDNETRASLFKFVSQSTRRLIGTADEKTVPVDPNVRFLRESVTGDPGPSEVPVLDKVRDPSASFTFFEAWKSLSALKELSRRGGRGAATEEPPVGVVKALINALEEDLDVAARQSPLREQYQQFVRRYRADKTRLDEGVVADIMQKRGNNYRINNEEVFNSVFQREGTTEAQQLFDLIKDDPEALRGMREGIGDFYRKFVGITDEGEVNIRRHRQFMSEYGKPLGVFFSKQEIRVLNQPNRFQLVLNARRERRDRVVKELNNSFDAKLANLDNPSKLKAFLLDKNNVSGAKRALEILNKTPEVLRGIRSEIRKDIAETITSRNDPLTGEPVFSASNMQKLLFGKSGERGSIENLRVIFGDQYVNDLTTLQRSLAIAARRPVAVNRSNTSFWNDTVKILARAHVGLFTRPGRVITALDRIRQRASNRVLFKSVVNPDDLRDLMALRGVDLRTEKAAAIIGGLGGSALLADFGPEPVPPLQQ